jgi:hypothetical protein
MSTMPSFFAATISKGVNKTDNTKAPSPAYRYVHVINITNPPIER